MENINLLDKNAWDDSALIKSWNQALKEYRKYHSIHAKGEMVEDALREQELSEETVKNSERKSTCGTDDITVSNDFQQPHQGDGRPASREYTFQKDDPSQASLTDVPEIPESLLNGHLKDKKPLKNLMMSWYFAGYYTGFFEGQKEAQQQREKEETVK